MTPETVASDTPAEAEQRARNYRIMAQQRMQHTQSAGVSDDAYLEAARINAAGMVMMGFGIGGGFRQPIVTPAPYQPLPVPAYNYQGLQREAQPQQCTYNRIGQTIYQNCY